MAQTSDYMFLIQESIPCWHEISFDVENMAIIMGVHRDFLNHMPVLTTETPIVAMIIQECGCKVFHGDFQGEQFGFNGAFEKLGEKNGFIRYSVRIPALEQFYIVTCDRCQGHTKDLFGSCSVCQGVGKVKRTRACSSCDGKKEDQFGEVCRYCKGVGKTIDSWMDWDSFYAISATLSLFFDLMFAGQDKDKLTSCKAPQLLLLTTATNRGMNVCPISGTYGIPLVNWLLGRHGEIEEVTSAIARTWEKGYGSFDDMDKMNIYAEIRTNGWLGIGCPGDRAGLHPNFNCPIARGKGYEFSDHNVDTPLQQLTLLAGLGALCDKVRSEIK